MYTNYLILAVKYVYGVPNVCSESAMKSAMLINVWVRFDLFTVTIRHSERI